MPFKLVLTLDYNTDTNWRWVLRDTTGRFLADQEVLLDTDDAAYESFEDLPGQLQYQESVRPAEEVMAELGAWMGTHVFGAVGEKLLAYEQSPACVVQVRVPPEAQNLLFRPFELAHLNGKPLAERGFRFIYTVARGSDHKPGRGVLKDDGQPETLRMLGVFSLPRDATPLNLRQERYRLQQLVRRFVQTRGQAVELRLLQYGATRELLADVLQEAPGWDVLHFSGHGLEGELMLEKPDGTADRIDAEELAEMLRPASARLKLLTLSACYSGAADVRAARAQIGLDNPPTRVVPPAQAGSVLPSLGQRLAEELGCAVLAMRYPVIDEFATELALTLYETMLDKKQPLAQALQLALADALNPKNDPYLPTFSRLTPLLFGERAAELRLQAPPRSGSFTIPQTGLFNFPPQPERFVGRLMPMLRASQALAPESGKTGVLFYGMAGAGKTACALELAYGYDRQNLERFTAFVWHKAPEEKHDITNALTEFALSLENQLPGLELVGLMDAPEDFKRKALPRLRALLQSNAILLVLDNLEGLLTSRGDWRDARWGDLLNVLLDHNGYSRLVITSRRVPTTLKNHPRLQADTIHALSFQESVILARELPHLKGMFKAEAGREKLQRILRSAQGHPKLLELASSMAADPAALDMHLARSESASGEADATRRAFFRTGETDRAEDIFVKELRRWTEGTAENLSSTARLLAQFLARLEDSDRTMDIVQANWEYFLKRLTGDVAEGKQAAPEPASDWAQAALSEPDLGLEAALNQLAQAGLIEIEPIASTATQQFHIHPGVAEALLSSEPFVLNAIDIELGDYFSAMYQHGLDTEMQGGGQMVVEGARHAAPYLLRAQRWEVAARLLERMLQRDTSQATLALAIPLLRQIVEKTEGTAEGLENAVVLSNTLFKADRFTEAERMQHDLIAKSVAQGNYRLASAALSQLFNLLYVTSRYEEALRTAEEVTVYAKQAGLGPWSQLLDEGMRLQALHALGRYEEVLAAVEQHSVQMKDLPEENASLESINPWNVREVLLNIGYFAARDLEQWETALAFNAEIAEYERKRGAGAVEHARTRFNDYFPLLRLKRYDEARALLESCRVVFERENAIYELSLVYTALADLEDSENNPASAVRFEQTALRFSYYVGRPMDCAISHSNLANYIQHAEGGVSESALAHRLAAGIIYYQISSGTLPMLIRNIAHSSRPPAPPSFAQVCASLEQIEGVRFQEMFAQLPKRAPDGDAAIQAVWQMAIDEAARMQEDLPNFEPLLQGIAEVARGNSESRAEIEEILPQLEEKGWHIASAAQRIWAGERDADALTAGLDEQDAALVRRALELLETP